MKKINKAGIQFIHEVAEKFIKKYCRGLPRTADSIWSFVDEINKNNEEVIYQRARSGQKLVRRTAQ